MTRREFLKKLAKMWEADGAMSEAMCLEDLLDDAATIGLEGASRAYFHTMETLVQ